MANQEKRNPAIIGKAVIKGQLTLASPLLIGSGDAYAEYGNQKDTHVLRNKRGIPFIPGSSIAGVLRSLFTQEWKRNEEGKEYQKICQRFFGALETDANRRDGWQSAIQIDDVLLPDGKIVFRDGVGIDSVTRTAEKGKKYDYEAVEKGACGNFYMEITIRRAMIQDLTFSGLSGLDACRAFIKMLAVRMEQGIQLGALTSKGFGRVKGTPVQAYFFDFTKINDVEAWLFRDDIADENTANTLDHNGTNLPESKKKLLITAEFSILHSLIVRTSEEDTMYSDEDQTGGQMAAFSKMSGDKFVIPGTSLKGVLRHRASDILDILGMEEQKKELKLADLMGCAKGEIRGDSEEEKKLEKGKKSRFHVDEVYIPRKGDVLPANQTRNRIDRFTGGTIDAALFTERPLWQKKKEGKAASSIQIHLEIDEAEEWEVGLALFLLKDLWIGRLAIGGGKSIGRGVLQGHLAEIYYDGDSFQIGEGGKTSKEDAGTMNVFADMLREEAGK